MTASGFIYLHTEAITITTIGKRATRRRPPVSLIPLSLWYYDYLLKILLDLPIPYKIPFSIEVQAVFGEFRFELAASVLE